VNILNKAAMKQFALAILLFLSFDLASCRNGDQHERNEEKDLAEPLFPKGEKITNGNFTGNAWLHQMIMSDSLNPTQVGSVTFAAGARTNWHLHPGGQILLITDGTAYYQEKGSPKRVLKKGDVVKCPPNMPHWHGASKDEDLIQIAITNMQEGATLWLEKVKDEEYDN
jgi:quercetin dioxygenase-like cupin family protein